MREFKLRVGELVIQFRAAGGVSGFALSQDHGSFVTGQGSPHCLVNVHYGPVPDLDMGAQVFQSGGLWSLYRRDGRYSLPMVSPVWGSRPYRLSVFDTSFRSGDLYISNAPSSERDMTQNLCPADGDGAIVDPLAYPLDEVLVVNLLAREGGLNIHACGVDLGGWGLAFCGTSGTGKSTLARLWEKRGALLLSDDRLILRQKEDSFWVFGTPWHGEASLSFPGGTPLERIYFMVQAPANRVRDLSQVEAASRLLVHAFPPFYDPAGMERTLRFIQEICRAVPCYDLGFVPDESVLDYFAGVERGG